MHPISIAPLLIGPSTLLSTSLGQAGSAKGLEAALQVIENVLDVLGADGQADGALVNALVLELFEKKQVFFMAIPHKDRASDA